jgi:hypothetical protein
MTPPEGLEPELAVPSPTPEQQSAGSTVWQDRTRGRKLASYWLATSIVGAFAIATTLGIPRLLLPVALLLVYSWLGYRHVQRAGGFVALRSARVSQLADSLYFLGFLWTLFALIDSFVIRHVSQSDAVFQSFGFALVTTATGMFLRLFMLQFGYSEEDQIELGERKVEEEIASFSVELKEARKSIEGFRKESGGALRAWITSMSGSTEALRQAVHRVEQQTVALKDELMKMHTATVQQTNKMVESSLEQSTKRLSDSVSGLHAQVDHLTKDLQAGANTITKSVSHNIAKMDAVVATGIKQLDLEIKESAEEMKGGYAESSKIVANASKAFAEKLGLHMAKLENGLEKVVGQLQAIEIPKDVIGTAISEELATATEGLKRSLLSLQTSIEASAGSVTTILNKQLAAVDNGLQGVSKQIQSIRVPADLVEKRLGDQLTASVSGLVKTIRDLQAAIESNRSAVTASAKRSTTLPKGFRRWLGL